MGLFQKIKRYAALSTGNFDKLFKDKEIPTLPEVVMKLLERLKNPDVHLEDVASIVETDPGLSAQVLKMANSPLYGFRSEIKNVKHAISALGLKRLEQIAISYGVKKAVKDPKAEGFDFNLFWSTSLYRAIMSKEISIATGVGGPDEAFTGALLQDIALPVLLKDWYREYKHVYDKWKSGREPLSKVEERTLSWTHAQAGAWMAKRWGFPAMLICCIGLHPEPLEKAQKLGLGTTAVVPVMLSQRIPMRFPESEMEGLAAELDRVGLTMDRLLKIEEKSYETLLSLASTFNIRSVKVKRLQEQLQKA